MTRKIDVNSILISGVPLWLISAATAIATTKFTGHSGRVEALAIDGNYLFSASSDNTIIQWDRNTREIYREYFGHTQPIWDILIDGKFLYSASNDSTAIKWNIETGNRIKTFKGHKWSVNSLEISDTQLYTGSGDWYICIWDKETGSLKSCLKSPSSGVYSIALTPDETLFSGHADGRLIKWDVKNQNPSAISSTDPGSIFDVKYHDGYIYTASNDSIILKWNPESFKPERSFIFESFPVWTMAFSGDNIYAVNQGGKIAQWDLSKHKFVKSYNLTSFPISVVSDNTALYVGGGDNNIYEASLAAAGLNGGAIFGIVASVILVVALIGFATIKKYKIEVRDKLPFLRKDNPKNQEPGAISELESQKYRLMKDSPQSDRRVVVSSAEALPLETSLQRLKSQVKKKNKNNAFLLDTMHVRTDSDVNSTVRNSKESSVNFPETSKNPTDERYNFGDSSNRTSNFKNMNPASNSSFYVSPSSQLSYFKPVDEANIHQTGMQNNLKLERKSTLIKPKNAYGDTSMEFPDAEHTAQVFQDTEEETLADISQPNSEKLVRKSTLIKPKNPIGDTSMEFPDAEHTVQVFQDTKEENIGDILQPNSEKLVRKSTLIKPKNPIGDTSMEFPDSEHTVQVFQDTKEENIGDISQPNSEKLVRKSTLIKPKNPIGDTSMEFPDAEHTVQVFQDIMDVTSELQDRTPERTTSHLTSNIGYKKINLAFPDAETADDKDGAELTLSHAHGADITDFQRSRVKPFFDSKGAAKNESQEQLFPQQKSKKFFEGEISAGHVKTMSRPFQSVSRKLVEQNIKGKPQLMNWKLGEIGRIYSIKNLGHEAVKDLSVDECLAMTFGVMNEICGISITDYALLRHLIRTSKK